MRAWRDNSCVGVSVLKARRWLWRWSTKNSNAWFAISRRSCVHASSTARCARSITEFASPKMANTIAPTAARRAITRRRTRCDGGQLKLETRNWKLGTGNRKLETGDWKLEIRNSKFETGKSKANSNDGVPSMPDGVSVWCGGGHILRLTDRLAR